jgi:hypothetical protein
MRRRFMSMFTPLLLAGCAAQADAPDEARAAPAGAKVSCIDPARIVTRSAAPPGAILFDMTGGTTYRNEVVGACPGIARATAASIVQLEIDGTRLCRNDSVRVYDPVEARATGAAAFARCRLGDFTPVPRR